jgi:ribosomal protein S20
MGAMRTALRKARTALEGSASDAPALVTSAIRSIDKAVTKGVLQRRAASRLISRLSRKANTTAS